jgi:hypothetical protein
MVQQVLKKGTWNSTSMAFCFSFEPVIPKEDCNGETAEKRAESKIKCG